MEALTQMDVLRHACDKFVVLVETDAKVTDTKIGVRIYDMIENGEYIPYYIDYVDIDGSKDYAVLHGRDFLSGVKITGNVLVSGNIKSEDRTFLAFDAEEVMDFLGVRSRYYRGQSDYFKGRCKAIDDRRDDLYQYMDLARL